MTAELRLSLDKSVKRILRLLLEQSRRAAGKVSALIEGQTKDSGVLYASQRSTLARSVYITFVDLIQRVRGTLNAASHKSK
jgi:hypothetical protein